MGGGLDTTPEAAPDETGALRGGAATTTSKAPLLESRRERHRGGIGARHVVPQLAPWRARIDCSTRGLPLAGAEVAPGIDTDLRHSAIGAESCVSTLLSSGAPPAHCAPSAQTRA